MQCVIDSRFLGQKIRPINYKRIVLLTLGNANCEKGSLSLHSTLIMGYFKSICILASFIAIAGCQEGEPTLPTPESDSQQQAVVTSEGEYTPIASKSDSLSVEEELSYAEERLLYQQYAAYEKEAWVVNGPMVIFFHPDTATRVKKIKRWGQDKFFEKANDAVVQIHGGVLMAQEMGVEFIDTYAKNFAFVVNSDTIEWKRPWSINPWGAYLFNGQVPPQKVELSEIEQKIQHVYSQP